MTDQLNTNQYKIFWGLIIFFCAYGLFQVISHAWCSDDAFISFRYAQNLIDGNGLVYNVGERVEAYTNFLWTILIALGILVFTEPVLYSQVLSILFYMGTVFIFIALTFRLSKESKNKYPLPIPVAAFMLLVHHEFHIFATSGLETTMASGRILSF